jgi:Ca2+/Na+ antiporter
LSFFVFFATIQVGKGLKTAPNMSLRVFQVGVFTFTLLALGAWLGVVLTVDPSVSGLPGRILFFGSFFAFLLGLVMGAMISLYKKGLGEERAAQHLGAVFRQTLFLTSFFFINLFLLYRGIWVWWLVLLFFAFVLLLEFTMRTLKQESRE